MTYLDIKANYPIEMNNTFLLYLLAMRGIFINLNDDFRVLYHIHRSGDILLNKAIDGILIRQDLNKKYA